MDSVYPTERERSWYNMYKKKVYVEKDDSDLLNTVNRFQRIVLINSNTSATFIIH